MSHPHKTPENVADAIKKLSPADQGEFILMILLARWFNSYFMHISIKCYLISPGTNLHSQVEKHH